MAAPDGLDLLLTQLGVGKWNYLFYATSLLVPATIPGFLIGGEFFNPLPVFTCNLPNNNYTSYNGSECLMVEEQQQQVVPCSSWIYDTSVFTSTVAMEWDLVCERENLAPLFQTIFTVGCFLGSILAAVAAHRYGRRWAVRVGAVWTVVGVVLLTVAPWFSLALVARFLLGVFNTIMVYPAFMLSMEVCEPRVRPTVCMMLALPYAIMTVALAGLAYCIREWRPLQLAASFPCLLLLPVVYLVDESPRWLVIHGRLEEAVKVLERAFLRNGVPLPDLSKLIINVSTINKKQNNMTGKQLEEETLKSSQISCIEREMQNVRGNGAETTVENSVWRGSEEGGERDVQLGTEDGFGAWWAGPVALVSTPCMRKRMGVLLLMWMFMAIVYLSVPLGSEAFSSPFLYMALLGVVEVPAYTLAAPVTQRLGRRSVISFCLFSSGLLLLSLFAITVASIHEERVVLLLVMVSYFLTCTAYQVNFLYTPELLPTSLRPWGTAVCTLASYLGFSIPPFITDKLAQDLPWFPPMLFGCVSLLSGVLVLLLPETNGRPLPETVADLRHQETNNNPSMRDHVY